MNTILFHKTVHFNSSSLNNRSAVDRISDSHHGGGGGGVGIQHNLAMNGNADSQWLWWLIMGFGMLICVRAILQYLRIKRWDHWRAI